MIIMDLKGGSWAGDMYQKFEAMCVEVEEAMFEDTFKYVENHVRTVGETVNKFYSDVMLDLLPPSSLDPVKAGDHLSTVVQLGDGKICKNPKVDEENESLHAASDQLVKDVGFAVALEDRINYRSCSANCSVIKPCGSTFNDSAGEKCSKENSLSHDTELLLSKRATSVEKVVECTNDSLNESVSNSPCTNIGAITKSVESHSEDGVEISEEMMEYFGGDDVVKVNNISILSGGHMETDLVWQLSKSTDLDLSSIKANLSTMISSKVDVESTIETEVDLSSIDIETSSPYHSCEFKRWDADEQVFLVDVQLNEVKLGESCVLVEKNDDNFSRDMPKSYKKKIQDVLSPRRWSKSKRNQAACYEVQSRKNLASTCMMQTEIQRSQTSESFESDWELL